jgi:hypothetical protein
VKCTRPSESSVGRGALEPCGRHAGGYSRSRRHYIHRGHGDITSPCTHVLHTCHRAGGLLAAVTARYLPTLSTSRVTATAHFRTAPSWAPAQPHSKNSGSTGHGVLSPGPSPSPPTSPARATDPPSPPSPRQPGPSHPPSLSSSLQVLCATVTVTRDGPSPNPRPGSWPSAGQARQCSDSESPRLTPTLRRGQRGVSHRVLNMMPVGADAACRRAAASVRVTVTSLGPTQSPGAGPGVTVTVADSDS